MSVKIMTAVWGTALKNRTQKLVLLALADNAHDSGLCWPSIKNLAEKCDMTENGVRGIIKQLVDQGLVSYEEAGGGHRSNRYIVLPPNGIGGSTPLGGQHHGVLTPMPLGSAPNAIGGNHKETTSKPPSKETPGEIPTALAGVEFATAWADWLADRKERKKPMTARAQRMALALLEPMGVARAIAAIQLSIANGWQGIHEGRASFVRGQRPPLPASPGMDGASYRARLNIAGGDRE